MRPCALTLVLTALPLLGQARGETAAPPTKLWTEQPSGGGKAAVAPALPAFARLVRRLGPAVVSILVQRRDEERGAASGSREQGQGSGFIIHPSGLIVTNHHVVARATDIQVLLADQRKLAARLVGSDERTDMALVRIEAGALPVLPLGDSDALAIGDWVLAIGNPFGLDHTVTFGIVSAKGRREVRPGGAPSDNFFDFIQTDAAINVGNSGGPLINLRGEVIGITTAINPHGQGISFAIPINMAKTVVPLLHRHGRVPRGWLGLSYQTVTPTLRSAFGFPEGGGALVTEVLAGSPAAQAGIASGDLILAFDGHPIRRADDLGWMIDVAPSGRPVAIQLLREGQRRQVSATPGPAPDAERPGVATAAGGSEPTAAAPAPSTAPPPTALGIIVSEINVGLARELADPSLRGLVVTSIEPMCPAAEAGIERGDVLVRVGQTPVRTIEDYAQVVHAIPRGGVLKLLVRRRERSEGERSWRSLWVAFPRR